MPSVPTLTQLLDEARTRATPSTPRRTPTTAPAALTFTPTKGGSARVYVPHNSISSASTPRSKSRLLFDAQIASKSQSPQPSTSFIESSDSQSLANRVLVARASAEEVSSSSDSAEISLAPKKPHSRKAHIARRRVMSLSGDDTDDEPLTPPTTTNPLFGNDKQNRNGKKLHKDSGSTSVEVIVISSDEDDDDKRPKAASKPVRWA